MQGADQPIRSSLGFSVLPKDTWHADEGNRTYNLLTRHWLYPWVTATYNIQLLPQFLTNQSFMREWQRETHCWRKIIISWLEFTQRHVGDSKLNWKKVLWPDETNIFSAIRLQAMFGRCHTTHMTTNTPSPLWSMVLEASCCGDAPLQQASEGL